MGLDDKKNDGPDQRSWSLFEMRGVSMAPWLKPEDVLLVDASVAKETIRAGDVIVFLNRGTGETVVHRVVRFRKGNGFPFETKGDRSREIDPVDADVEFQGKALRRLRSGKWKFLRFGRLLRFLSVFGLYPGQRFPRWMSRTSLLKVLGSRAS